MIYKKVKLEFDEAKERLNECGTNIRRIRNERLCCNRFRNRQL